MKKFRYNKNYKWYKKINYIKIIVLFIIILVGFFLLFNFFGQSKDMESAFKTSILVSLLITLGVIINDMIENRSAIYVEKNKKVFVVERHIDFSGEVISEKTFNDLTSDDTKVENIMKDQKKYEGVDLFEIKKVNKIKKHSKLMCVYCEIEINEWIGKGGRFVIDHYELVKSMKKAKLVIPCDYNDYDELYDLLLKIK